MPFHGLRGRAWPLEVVRWRHQATQDTISCTSRGDGRAYCDANAGDRQGVADMLEFDFKCLEPLAVRAFGKSAM